MPYVSQLNLGYGSPRPQARPSARNALPLDLLPTFFPSVPLPSQTLGQRRFRVRCESKYVMVRRLTSTEMRDQCTSRWMGISRSSLLKMST